VVQVTDVVPHPVARIKKCLDMLPGALERVRMIARTHINETDRVIHSLVCVCVCVCVCVAVRCYVPVCRPPVTDDCSTGFGLVTKNSHQPVRVFVRNGN